MNPRQILWLGTAGIALVILAVCFPPANSTISGGALAAASLAIWALRMGMENRATYIDQLRPVVSEHGFEIVSSTSLGWFGTGPFPKVHVISQPYVRTKTPIGQGEFVKYRELVLRDVSGRRHTTCALLEFKAFQCTRILFKPPLESLVAPNALISPS